MIVVALVDGPHDGDFIACNELCESDFKDRNCANVDGFRYFIGEIGKVPKGSMVKLYHTGVFAGQEDLEITR